MHILVISSTQAWLKEVQPRLQEEGAVVSTADNVFDARTKLTKLPIDLVICATNMPRKTGVQFLVEWRKEGLLRAKVPFILVVERVMTMPLKYEEKVLVENQENVLATWEGWPKPYNLREEMNKVWRPWHEAQANPEEERRAASS